VATRCCFFGILLCLPACCVWQPVVFEEGSCKKKKRGYMVCTGNYVATNTRKQRRAARSPAEKKKKRGYTVSSGKQAVTQRKERRGVTWCAQATTSQRTPEELDCKGLNAGRHSPKGGPRQDRKLQKKKGISYTPPIPGGDSRATEPVGPTPQRHAFRRLRRTMTTSARPVHQATANFDTVRRKIRPGPGSNLKKKRGYTVCSSGYAATDTS
jgi:hypothetical protein